VQRDLHGLLAQAQAARARTSRIRSAAEGVAAARLLAGAGFDAARLDAEVASLELQPTLEDVFPGGPGWAGTGGADGGIAAAAAAAAAVAAGGGGGALGAYGVEAYLQQVQDMAVLAAIQEAQQDAISSFERHMDTALAKEWAADKGRLLTVGGPGGAVGGSAAGAGGGRAGTASLFGAGAFRGAGSPVGGGRGGGGLLGGGAGAGTATATATAAFTGGAQLQPREQAYLAAMRKLNAAAAKGGPVDAVAELGAAAASASGGGGAAGAAATSDGGGAATTTTTTTGIAATWSLLRDILSVAHAKGLKPGSCSPSAFTGALVAGARQHLQAGFAAHMRATVARHRAAAHRGGDPDRLREVQAYLALRLRDRGALDLQQVGGHDTSWAQVYHALRAGYDDVALRAAERATDPGASATGAAAAMAAAATLPGGGGGGGRGGGDLRPLLAAWLEDRAAFRAAHGAAMLRECERAAQARAAAHRGGAAATGPSSSSSVRLDYMVLVYALLAGDARAVDALSRESPHLFATIEDFMWLKLALVSTDGGAGAGGGGASPSALQQPAQQSALGAAPAYRLPDLQAEINRWPASYYSRSGKEPLLYATVLLLSLQFSRALRFLWRDESASALRADAVHLAAALWFAGVLGPGTGLPDAASAVAGGAGGATPLQQQQQQQQPPFDVVDAFAQYGRRFVPSDPDAALQYLMPAAQASGGGLTAKGRMLRELLARCGDPAAVLGAAARPGQGAAAGPSPLDAFVANADERRGLLEAVAYECQLSHQPDEARALFMAAGRPRLALSLVSERLSAALVGGGAGAGGAGASGGLVGPATTEAPDVPALLQQGDEAVAAMEAEAAGGGAVDDASRRDAAAFSQLKAVRALLQAARRGQWAAALQEAARLSFVPDERARVEVCRREVRALDAATRARLPDVLAALAESLLGAKAEAVGSGAGPDADVRLNPLRARAEALKAFVLADLDPSIPPSVYARVNDVVRELS
jgi:nuclear pore complex protein Nup93